MSFFKNNDGLNDGGIVVIFADALNREGVHRIQFSLILFVFRERYDPMLIDAEKIVVVSSCD